MSRFVQTKDHDTEPPEGPRSEWGRYDDQLREWAVDAGLYLPSPEYDSLLAMVVSWVRQAREAGAASAEVKPLPGGKP